LSRYSFFLNKKPESGLRIRKEEVISDSPKNDQNITVLTPTLESARYSNQTAIVNSVKTKPTA